jgi:outer membrane murein-binding lipoprotein Lpp
MFREIKMKKILLFILILGVVGCSQSELDKLKSDEKSLNKQIEELDEESKKYHQPCMDMAAEYESAVAKGLPNTKELKKKGGEICMKAFNAENKSLELRKEIMNIQLAIIQETAKKGE